MLLPLEQEDLMCLHITGIPGAAMLPALASGDAVYGVVQGVAVLHAPASGATIG